MSEEQLKPVLIADDDPTNCDLVEAFVIKSGFAAVIVTNGEQAVEQANETAFHAILLDISMPILDGKQAAKLIRELSAHNRDTPIAALTAYEITLDDPTMAGASINALFRKPVDWSALTSWLLNLNGPDEGHQANEQGNTGKVEINHAIINQMRESLPPATVARLFGRFKEDLANRLTELDKAIANQDIEQARKTTHALCGIASAFGAISLENHARDLHNNVEQIFAMIESGALDKLKTLATNSEATLHTLFQEPA